MLPPRISMCVLSLAATTCSAYTVAPVTDDMRSAAAAIRGALLPPIVTEDSSVAFSRLAYIVDTFGPRFSGSDGLELALSHVASLAAADGLTVTEEETFVPRWVRGAESVTLISPRHKSLHAVGLGMSTPGNVSAPVFVVADNVELQAGSNCSKAAGQIVLFNTLFTTYGATVATRSNAGLWASACGAVGALIRSVGPYSLQNPHTGFTENSTIPSAAVSNEDASQLQRMFKRGQAPVVQMAMASEMLPPRKSRNLLIDLVGTTLPDEFVVVSGHGDSWDIAEGAMDDGGGFVASWEAVRTLKVLGLRPARTVRAIVWVNEENGEAGGLQYARDFTASGVLAKHSMVLETDSGAFSPFGIGVSCAATANGGCGAAIAQLTLLGAELLAPIGSGNVTPGGGGTDIDASCKTGVPCVGLNVLDARLSPGANNPCTAGNGGAWGVPVAANPSATYDSAYFFTHHAASDTMERLDPRQLNHVAAALATWAYAVASLPELLPRDAPAPPSPGGGASPVVIAVSVSAAVLVTAAAAWMLRSRLLTCGCCRGGAGGGTPGAKYNAV